jgi:HEAT repeat protein
MANQPHAADDVSDELADEYLVELTHTADGERRTHLVVPVEAYRPSMLPPGGPPSALFQPLGTGDRLVVRLSDIVDVRLVHPDGPNPALLERVLSTLARVVAADPHLLAADTASAAIDAALAQENPAVTARAALVARRWSDGHDTSQDLLDSHRVDETALVNPLVELAEPGSPDVVIATALLSDIAAAAPVDALDAVPRLTTVAAEGDSAARQYAFYALACIASEYPEQVFPAVDVLVGGIESTDETVQSNASAALGRIASGYPDVAASIVNDLAALFESESATVRGNAAGLLADIADEHPAEVVAYVDELFAVLVDEESAHQTRINASVALLAAGEADPGAVRSHHQHLEEALEDPASPVRKNACALIGHSDAPVSLDPLRTLRDSDIDESVRDRAGWALERQQ